MSLADGLAVLVPTRGRPHHAVEFAEAFVETCTADTWLVFVVDDDDPCREAYIAAVDGEVVVASSRNMGEALQAGVEHVLSRDPFAVGFMGDDHRPRTVGWDKLYLAALRDLGTGIVYGDDLIQGERLPTQVAVTADIPRTLGFLAPPGLVHLYLDNFWLDLGNAAGCLRYLPDVVVEHMHPFAGKGDMDDGYRRVNAPEMYAHDEGVYDAYRASRFDADVEAVRALRGTG